MTGPRVLVAGCGRMGTLRAAAARTLGAQVSAVLDPVAERAESLAAGHPGTRMLDPREPLDWDDFDAVFVCTPPASRGLEVEAVRAGVPVLIEKPLGIDAMTARELVDAWRETEVRTAVGYMNRYRLSVQNLRRRFAAAPPFALACQWVAGRYARSWWDDPATSGGPLNDLATHLVDLCRFVAGEIEAVSAHTRDATGEVAATALRLRSGACATLLCSCLAHEKHIAFEAFSTDRVVRLEGWDLHPAGEPASADPNAVFLAETAAFLGGGRVLSDVGDAWRTQLAVDAIRRATRTGALVELPA